MGNGWQSPVLQDFEKIVLRRPVGIVPGHEAIELGASGFRSHQRRAGQSAGIVAVRQPVGSYGAGAVRVGQHRKGKLQLVDHGGVPAGIIDVDRRHPETGSQYLGMALRQADQLAVAIWSPVAAQEDQEHPGVQMIGQPPRLPRLVVEGEVGDGHCLGL